MKILTVVGARPQFIKAAAVSRVIRGPLGQELGLEEFLVHTGQHYDENMSRVFFEQLQIPEPDVNLEIGSGPHGAMTGRMLESLESVMLEQRPDTVLVYGDTNSTLAGALAAAKLHIPVAHVEAGLRSFNRRMPEEVNRLVADHVSALLFCPTQTAVDNLKREGIAEGVHLVGDVMYDTARFFSELARERSVILSELALREQEYALVTIHRQENTDDADRLARISEGLALLAEKLTVVFPVHPRTRRSLQALHLLDGIDEITMTDPLPYLDIVALERDARVILTDSGGMQKEAFFHRVPCLTLRDETEWVETVALGWNRIVGADSHAIGSAVEIADSIRVVDATASSASTPAGPYGTGRAAHEIVKRMAQRST